MRTLKEVLDNELSADNVKNMKIEDLKNFLLDNKIVNTEADMNMIVIEGIQKAMEDDDEFPIHYYTKDEPIHEEARYVDPGEQLTDEYIESNFN